MVHNMIGLLQSNGEVKEYANTNGGGGGISPSELLQVSDNIAPKQATNTASELIPAGKYFVNSEGKLCQCDVQIASGGTIVVGSNCHLIPDGGINELNSKIGYSLNSYIDRPPWLLAGQSITINKAYTNAPILIYAMNSTGHGCMFLYDSNYGQFYTIKNDADVVTFSVNNGDITITADSTYTFIGFFGLEIDKKGFTINN